MSIIVLTAGHSSTDPGACSGGHTEAGLMLELRDVTAEMLRDLGHVGAGGQQRAADEGELVGRHQNSRETPDFRPGR